MPKQASELQTALRVVMMPRDANNYGSIFGGVILSYIDQAGYIEARKHGMHRWVTASMERVDFKAPVHLGDIVSFLTQTEATGTSSVKVRIRVEAERFATGEIVHVTEAHSTMVAVDAAGRPIPYRSPPTIGTTTTAGESSGRRHPSGPRA
ncbi:MAG: acyl-CoA thioesterase [Phycisphaerales bacterium]|nr:acyl-CoA thioesterase [Phycisphaerales bacterium]MCI0631027.1 acyl-CoA thioesterase [Phycisphaerales bacterium]MCI0676232.1 acyl-CoA thioesterase [Phycisphaerales bacterium]